jgi:hypothetical protein
MNQRAPEVRTRINSTKEDKECKGRVYAIAKTHISDRCKIQKCTQGETSEEKKVAQLCEELARAKASP